MQFEPGIKAHHSSRAAGLAGLLFCVMPGIGLGACPPVGYVYDTSKAGDCFVVKPGGGSRSAQLATQLCSGDGSRSAQLATQLCSGDVICCEGGQDCNGEKSITVVTTDGISKIPCDKKGHKVCGRSQPWVLSGLGAVAKSVTDQTLDWLADLHRSANAQTIALATVRDLADKGALLAMPMMGPSGTRIGAGRRELHLAWVGGRAPFRVRLDQPGGGPVLADLSGLKEHRADIAGSHLSPGAYRLSLSDASGQDLEMTLSVIAPEQIPPLPAAQGSAPGGVPATPVTETIHAAWLLRQNMTRWSLEAYQEVYPHGDAFATAKLLRLKLEGRL